ncbi:putative DNA-binding protein [Actinacidiphila reveromycinica]|uniref:Putative DNA-binding protein n=1 Tax=Actinacidiphila reveromycinica TaxID=659352 RepID=A0A7U3UWG9_9ACTN|nr:helix-turn-helix transcriptional regulator [Streptomyces sp. SN-593]BBB00073.1 putative DNA-binding protein [Streptomyces sp. SN-593]
MSTHISQRQDGAAYFGQEVRFAREQRGMTQAQLAEETGYERPYVTRVESGKLLASEQFAEACDRIFGTPGFFARLRVRVSERGHPGWFIPYVNLERDATVILDYSPVVIPGILQTREYATAIFSQVHPRDEKQQVDERVEARLARRAALRQRVEHPLLWMVLHEAALRTVVGSRNVMAGQLARLLEEADSPHVAIQVSPFDQGVPGGASMFILLTPAEGNALLYTETMQHGHVEDSESGVAAAQQQYDRLRAAAMPPRESLALIRDVMKEYSQ